MRAITRLEGVGINTVSRLLTAAGKAARKHHNDNVWGIAGRRVIECDEVWSFVYAKQKNAPWVPKPAGDIWTFSALDTESKLVISYLVGSRTKKFATALMDDLYWRLEERPQITTDGLQAYVKAVKKVYGRDVDFAQTVKQYDPTGRRRSRAVRLDYPTSDFIDRRSIAGQPDMDRASTSYIERSNLTIRMCNRRFTRKTNAFSKSLAQHKASVHLYFLWYNFCRIHRSLGTTPAVESGMDDRVRDLRWLVELIDARTPPPKRPKHYKKR